MWYVQGALVLNLVTRLPWEKFEILIFYVGALHSFPFPLSLHYHYALLYYHNIIQLHIAAHEYS